MEFVIECDYDFDNGWILGEQREEIVRCMDCQHYKETDGLRRFNLAFCKFHSGPCESNGYCAWGERKDLLT